ncbi:MAG: type I methionyl aminopeptidase [Candidatus Improbicoccus devescovinae]|nr:MAG: type I methionyl aminopeptidase [Candidatus Improbicoccus devescovinae]
MILLKTSEEIEIMREAGRISALALQVAGAAIKPGISTKELDTIARETIISHGAEPGFLGENGFPATACISVNEEIIHTIPSDKKNLKTGDIVSIDVGARYKGFNGDNTCTFACGEISSDAQKLLDVTKKSLDLAIKSVQIGSKIGDISFTVQNYVETMGFFIIKKFVGHGIGRSIHEDPKVPNFGKPGTGEVIQEGLVIAIEPMVNQGTENIIISNDGWRVVTADGRLSAHFEHTVAATKDGPVILTSC